MPKPFFYNHKKKIEEIIRVDHAGEFGAQKIYEGQIDKIQSLDDKKLIQHMLDQELEHLEYFDHQMKIKNVRPTFLMPIWNICGYYVGAISAFLGIKSAMLVTEKVEEVIENHYLEQINYLQENDPDNAMLRKIIKFRQDELEHKHIAIENESEKAFANDMFATIIKSVCTAAIYLSKNI